MPKPIPPEADVKAATFSFPEHDGAISRKALAGPCLLHFYPKDNT
jgi:peroxiredoxin